MKQTRILILIALFLSTGALAFIAGITWQVKDGDYSIKFDTRGASGEMKGLKGTIIFDEGNVAQARFDVTVDVNTLNTGNNLKNKHAKAENFFDVEKYPVIRFTSTKVSKKTDGFQVAGKLTIKATTKDVVIPFTFSKNGIDGLFKGKFQINRKDYDLHKFGVGETVAIELMIPVKKAS